MGLPWNRATHDDDRRHFLQQLAAGTAAFTAGLAATPGSLFAADSKAAAARRSDKWLAADLMAQAIGLLKSDFNFSYAGIDTVRTLPKRGETRYIDPAHGNDDWDGKRHAFSSGSRGPWKTLNAHIKDGRITSAFNDFRILVAVGTELGPSNHPGNGAAPADLTGMYRLVGVQGFSFGPYDPAQGPEEIVTQDENPFRAAVERGEFIGPAELAAKYWRLDVGGGWSPLRGQFLDGPSCIEVDGGCTDIVIRGVAMQGFGRDAIRVLDGGYARLEDYWCGNSRQDNGVSSRDGRYRNPALFVTRGRGTLDQIRGWEDISVVDRLGYDGRPKGFPFKLRQIACVHTTTSNWAGGQHSDEAQSVADPGSPAGCDGYDAKWLCWQHHQPHPDSLDGKFYEGQAGIFNGGGHVASKQYCMIVSDCNMGYVDGGAIYNIGQSAFIALPQNMARGGGGGQGPIFFAGRGSVLTATDVLFMSKQVDGQKNHRSSRPAGEGAVNLRHVDTSRLT